MAAKKKTITCYRHVWTFVHDVHGDKMDLVLRSFKIHKEEDMKQATKYKYLIDLGYRYESFQIQELNDAFELFIVQRDK